MKTRIEILLVTSEKKTPF